jgi:hypothetical protein
MRVKFRRPLSRSRRGKRTCSLVVRVGPGSPSTSKSGRPGTVVPQLGVDPTARPIRGEVKAQLEPFAALSHADAGTMPNQSLNERVLLG